MGTRPWHVGAHADGTLLLRVAIRPLRDFRAAKLGLCVLHGHATIVGSRYIATGVGEMASGALPSLVEPQQVVDGVLTAMFPPFRSLALRSEVDGSDLTFDFTGDDYEMQDHRNWADVGFKSYSTPQARGGPWDYAAGVEFVRELRVSVDRTGVPPVRRASRKATVFVQAGPGRHHAFGISSTVRPDLLARSSPDTRRLLRTLAPRVLRLELTAELDGPACDELRRSLKDLGATLELVLVARDLRHARELVASLGPDAPVSSIMLNGAAPDGVVAEVTDLTAGKAARLSKYLAVGTAEVAAGTWWYFCQVNRGRPSLGESGRLTFSVSPQVHACDARTIISNLEAIPAMAETARVIYGAGVRLVASPVRLVPAQGPFHTGHVPRPASAPLTSDARLAGTFGAAWLVGTVHRLLSSGFSAASLLDVNGPEGIIVGPCAAPFDLPEGSLVMPTFHVLRALFGAEQLTALGSRDDASTVAAIAVRRGDRRQLLVASLSDEPISVDITSIADSHDTRWELNDLSVARAMVDPWGWADVGRPSAIRSDGPIHVAPFSVALLDLGTARPAQG